MLEAVITMLDEGETYHAPAQAYDATIHLEASHA